MSGQCNDADPKVCACNPSEASEVCGAMECGMKSDGCSGMVTCGYTCPTDTMCQGNSCVAIPMCNPDDCSNGCIPFVQVRCCKGDGTCGCRVAIGGSCN